MNRNVPFKLLGPMVCVATFFLLGISENGLHGTAHAQVPSSTNQQEKVVSGILKKWDVKEHQGMILTDLGEPVFFDIPQTNRMTKLSQGQQVTAKFDLQGNLITIIETPVPELKHPLR
ncbi:MAG: hypothetical protein NPIRA04_11680 [Nitrospirales bacterium]|nr:MAG: hypothetical protein NPIRA04_11680 [Nitrospirales bacterium]